MKWEPRKIVIRITRFSNSQNSLCKLVLPCCSYIKLAQVVIINNNETNGVEEQQRNYRMYYVLVYGTTREMELEEEQPRSLDDDGSEISLLRSGHKLRTEPCV